MSWCGFMQVLIVDFVCCLFVLFRLILVIVVPDVGCWFGSIETVRKLLCVGVLSFVRVSRGIFLNVYV